MVSKWVGDGRDRCGWRTLGCRLDTHMPVLGQSRNTRHLGTGSSGWSPHRCVVWLPTLSGAAVVICWLTSRCAGGLGIWDALLEVVLAGSPESFLKGWTAGSWLAGLKAEGGRGHTITLHPTMLQD